MIISKSIEKDHLIKHIHLQFDESKNVRQPIPQIQIDVVGSDILKQNPGYN